jgi:hypothetical protein
VVQRGAARCSTVWLDCATHYVVRAQVRSLMKCSQKVGSLKTKWISPYTSFRSVFCHIQDTCHTCTMHATRTVLVRTRHGACSMMALGGHGIKWGCERASRGARGNGPSMGTGLPVSLRHCSRPSSLASGRAHDVPRILPRRTTSHCTATHRMFAVFRYGVASKPCCTARTSLCVSSAKSLPPSGPR